MLEIRLHGRGGQGAVTAAELLALAAFSEGRHSQAFPSFGSERMGAPVVSFCRIDDRAIRAHDPITHPDALIVIDPSLVHQVDLFSGLGTGGFVLINSTRSLAELRLGELAERVAPERLRTVAATEIAREELGRPLPGAALLGGFAALTGAVGIDAVAQAFLDRFPGAVGEGNARAARRAFAAVLNGSADGASARPRPRPEATALLHAGATKESPAQAPGLVQLEGSQAVAEAIARCRPEVISAYPITPQTHIVEGLSAMVKAGRLEHCEYVNVESEFAAMSAAIGASAAGARAYTATASQGLLYMSEALYNASGLGLPIVMTVANRALGAPINIWNDHSDSMSQRDSGWIQLYVESNQEAVDVHLQAFKLAEELSLPVMVCVDGFVLTHAFERVELPSQDAVDGFLPPYDPRQVLDPAEPVTMGAMVGPEAFTEVRYLAHLKQMQALDLIPEIAAAFAQRFGRASGGLLHRYRTSDADTVIVALGSVLGTIQEVVDELREQGQRVGCLGIKAFRPWPAEEVRAALAPARRVVVLEKALSVGIGGIVSQNVHTALEGSGGVAIHTAIAGLGGRPITRATVRELVANARAGRLPSTSFIDLNLDLVQRELEREVARRRSGPYAENMLRDVGIVAASPVT